MYCHMHVASKLRISLFIYCCFNWLTLNLRCSEQRVGGKPPFPGIWWISYPIHFIARPPDSKSYLHLCILYWESCFLTTRPLSASIFSGLLFEQSLWHKSQSFWLQFSYIFRHSDFEFHKQYFHYEKLVCALKNLRWKTNNLGMLCTLKTLMVLMI